MNLYIAQNGATLGPYSEHQVREAVTSGIFGKDDLACPEGEEEWRPLNSFLPAPPKRIVSKPVNPARSQSTPQDTERVFFDEGAVRVTNTRFMVGRQTYAMRNITSVEPLKIVPNRLLPFVLSVIGLIVGIKADNHAALPLWGWALFLGSLCWLVLQRSVHVVVLHTSGAQVRAIESTKSRYVDDIVDALNRSIMSHS